MRNDRLQLLAYSMMLDANNVGIILPVQNNENDTDKTNEVIFDARRINTMENRIVKYHQMLLGMMKDSSSVADYIKEKAFDKRNDIGKYRVSTIADYSTN